MMLTMGFITVMNYDKVMQCTVKPVLNGHSNIDLKLVSRPVID